MSNYFNYTRSPLYSFLFTIPLFLIYEFGILLTSNNNYFVLRNGADVFIRQILYTFGISGLYWLGGLFFIGFIITFFIQRNYWRGQKINGDYFLFMMGESLLMGIILFFFMSKVHILLMNPIGNQLIQKVTLAIGAGIYEEFLFRVLLIMAIGSILGIIFQWSEKVKMWVAMVLASIIFSSFHFLGEYGDYFSFNLFMIRFLAGIILGILYFIRGFGITAWSHSIYDLIVLTRMTTG